MSCVRIRFYNVRKGKLQEALQAAEAGAAPLLQKQLGFIQYFVARTGLDQMVSVSLWDTEAHLDAANVRLEEWIERNIGDIIVSVDRHFGEVSFFAQSEEPPPIRLTARPQPEALH